MSIWLLEVGMPESCQEDFSKFLTFRNEVISFQRIKDYFLVNVSSESKEGIPIFVNSISEVYDITSLKQMPLCQGKCRNGTNCLNRTKYGDYCWRHKK